MKELFKTHLQTVLTHLDALFEHFGYEEIVLYSGEARSLYLDDNRYPFKPLFNFLYFVPLSTNPYSFFQYRGGQKPKLFIHQKADYWDSQPKPLEEDWTELFEVHYYSNLSSMKTLFTQTLHKSVLLTDNEARFKTFGFKAINDERVINYLHFKRSTKTAYEVACLREANEVAAKAHLFAKQAFLAGKTELQTHLAYLESIASRECNVPYDNIVAFNEHGAILHYTDYETKNFEAKSFLLDAGASVRGYHADITRTFYKEGHSEFKELVLAIDTLQQKLLAEVRVGVNFEQLQERMHQLLAQVIVDFKLMHLSVNEVYEQGYTKLFSPAGLGHYIGLQVHDVGNRLEDAFGKSHEASKKHLFLRLRKDLEVGNVLTIEPGIYIIEQLLTPHRGKSIFNWEKIDFFASYGGVRIEDSVHLHEGGVKNLTREFIN